MAAGVTTAAGARPRVVVVLGPTAAGKSQLGIDLAHRVNGEVVNADSMQLYQGMDIGTAKEPESAWHGVPHHLLDIWPVTQAANVADYQKLARAAIDESIDAYIPTLAASSGGLGYAYGFPLGAPTFDAQPCVGRNRDRFIAGEVEQLARDVDEFRIDITRTQLSQSHSQFMGEADSRVVSHFSRSAGTGSHPFGELCL